MRKETVAQKATAHPWSRRRSELLLRCLRIRLQASSPSVYSTKLLRKFRVNEDQQRENNEVPRIDSKLPLCKHAR